MAGEHSETGRKMSIMRIVQVLIRESDQEHPLTQQEILDYMEEKYGMTVSRKSVGRNLSRLKEAGLPVMCREVSRVVNGKESSLSLDWYWDHELSREDLKVLIDLLYFSHIPYQQVRQLSERLKRLQSHSFEDGRENVRNLPSLRKPADVDEIVAVLSRALTEKKKVSFYHDHYEVDGKRHHDYTVSGEDRLFKASPYQITASDGEYVLLCSLDDREDISAFSLSLLSDVSLLDEPLRPQKSLRSPDQGGKLSDYLFAHEELYSGAPVSCTFEADWHLMTNIVEDFGKSAHILSARQDLVVVEVVIPPSAMKAWVLKHAPLVKVTAPSYLVKEVKEAADGLYRLYGSP
jgi:predicted DNA-binding transcriptional regulator YafY